MSKEMTAVEYLKAKARMTNRCSIDCSECGIDLENNHRNIDCLTFENKYSEEAVAIVQKWAEEHPVKTRQSEFLKMFPNAHILGGAISISPCYVCDIKKENCLQEGCEKCRKDFWLAELPEEE